MKFESLELSFDSSINILIGDNETGKSTGLCALYLLFGKHRVLVN
ncbi:AAA family ATPase [Acinetobacter populi]